MVDAALRHLRNSRCRSRSVSSPRTGPRSRMLDYARDRGPGIGSSSPGTGSRAHLRMVASPSAAGDRGAGATGQTHRLDSLLSIITRCLPVCPWPRCRSVVPGMPPVGGALELRTPRFHDRMSRFPDRSGGLWAASRAKPLQNFHVWVAYGRGQVRRGSEEYAHGSGWEPFDLSLSCRKEHQNCRAAVIRPLAEIARTRRTQSMRRPGFRRRPWMP